MRTAALVSALVPAAASGACVLPAGPPLDRPAQVGVLCQFHDAADNDRIESRWGKPVIDLGGGKVVQVRVSEKDCVREENILFTDCALGRSVLISGKAVTEAGGRQVYSIRAAQTSGGGPIAISRDATVAGLIATATRHRIGYREQPEALVGLGRNRVPPSCGCRLFYPASPGARTN